MILGVLDMGENMMFSSLLVLKNGLPNVEPVCSGEIIDDITVWWQRARTLARILQSTFKSETGL